MSPASHSAAGLPEPPLEALAPAYREALALEAAGATRPELAEALSVPPQAVDSLLRIAHLKAAGASAPGGVDGVDHVADGPAPPENP
jgi:hypothetical protein